jgi:hypothetical protein
MKIVRAQKKIARLKGDVKEIKKRLTSCLNTVSENNFNEEFKVLYGTFTDLTNQMITLKSAVHAANIKGDMFKKILQLGELKSKIDFLKELEPKIGKQESRFGESTSVYKSQITPGEKNKMVEECQEAINNLTDELDEFNAKTDI